MLTGCPIRATKDKKLYIFRISHPKTSKIYDLAATMPSARRTGSTCSPKLQHWRRPPARAPADNCPGQLLQQRLAAALGLVPLHARGRVGHEAPDVPGAVVPDEYRDRIDGLLVEFVAQAREDADGRKFQTKQRDVKAYVRCAPRIGAVKGVVFNAHHPHKVPQLQLILELSKRYTFDPQLLVMQRVHVFSDHTWVDHLTFKAVFPTTAKNFVNLRHWWVLRGGSMIVVATYAEDDSFVKSQDPQIVISPHSSGPRIKNPSQAKPRT
ncbi:hypothetical protein PR003_g13499 [Phytophthora rubi]|uniref:Uncharacterized protein n=1 Tax=Phytophthora rubi TaxID=129364 RepID=A0A6A4F215_9STRA|nr:hypothetical protein PR002_g21481 [Phytophthora rubi]KAE9007948.1 hypothetical protein PR001_g16837 [Phytophthora rubi]KAE9334480.1 hypothetical protein PR003_g13499 [Phytophthora rubi]